MSYIITDARLLPDLRVVAFVSYLWPRWDMACLQSHLLPVVVAVVGRAESAV